MLELSSDRTTSHYSFEAGIVCITVDLHTESVVNGVTMRSRKSRMAQKDQFLQGRNERPLGRTPVRSIRCPQDIWDEAHERAEADNVTMSTVLRTLLSGYAQKQINLPRIRLEFDSTENKGGEE